MPFVPHPSASIHLTRRTEFGILVGVAASLAFATSGTFVRPLLAAGWTPGAAVFWRVSSATILLLPFGFWAMRRRWRLVLTEWRLIVAFGVLAVALAQGMYFAAVSRMSVSVALLIEYLAPVALVLLAWVRTGRRPTAMILSGTAISVVGLICVLDLTGAHLDALGVMFSLTAMIGAAAYFSLGARPSTLPALALPTFGLLVGAIVLGTGILTGLLPYSAPLVEVELMGSPLPWWVPLGVVVVFATAAAYTLGVAGTSLMGERLSSFVSLSEVLFATIIAAIVLGEVPTTVQLFGGGLIVVGVIVIRIATPTQLGLPNPLDEAAPVEPE